MTIKKEIKNSISKGQFNEAKQQLNLIGLEELSNTLFDLGYEDENICAYSFVCFLINKNETAEYHSLAADLLINSFSQLNGSYPAALYHVQRAIELDADDIDLKELLLFFNSIPEKLISDRTAQTIATEVLQKKPESKPARRILDESHERTMG